ncbi:MAG TPA: hypothetical protein VFS62_06780 [Chloroflexota bacterium]|nr:hypothetical protein [Chloroflexota bacterium]
MINLHQLLFTSLLLLMLLLGIWGLGAAAFNRAVGGSFRATYVLSIAVFLVQDLVGIVIFITGGRPRDMLHLLYGVAPLLALGLAFSYTSQQSKRREALWLGLAALFTFGLILRAASTGGTLAAS